MSNTLKCSSCNVVICELLAFIQNKQDVMDEKSLVTLCLSSFSEEDIDAAKSLLFSAVSQRKITRKKSNKSYKDLYDVLAVFKETNPDELPVFVAKELQKLPPLTFDHIDASRLLKDIILLKTELKTIKDTYVTQNQLLEMRSDLINAKNASIIDGPDHFVNLKRGGRCQNSFCFDSGPFGLPHIPVSTQPENESADCVNNQCPPSLSHSCEKNRSCEVRTVDKSSREDPVCTDNKVVFSTPVTTSRQNNAIPENMSGKSIHEPEEKSFENEWIPVQRKQNKNRFITTQGKATTNPHEKFKAADIKIPLFINNVDKSTKEVDIIEYINSKTQVIVNLKKINSKEQKQYSAYIVYVPKNKLSLFLNDSLWPEGVSFRRFIDFKRNPRQASVGLEKNKKLNGQ